MNMPLALLNRRRRIGGFSPSALFALAEPGVWYDPSDLTTMFQDNAGATPVTGTGQAVGLLLDKSKGLVLGTELVTNGDFSDGSTGWTLGAGWSITGGVASRDATAGGSNLLGGSGVEVGKTYRVSWTQLGSDFVGVYLGSAAGPLVSNINVAGSYTALVRATVTGGIVFRSGTPVTGVDNISVRELAGNHAVQATTGARPIYGVHPFGGRRNLQTFSESATNHSGVRATLANTQGTAPDGANTAGRVTETATTGDHRIDYIAVPVVSGSAYTFSVYLKAAERSWARVLLSSPAFGAVSVNFDLTLGQTGTATGATSSSIVSVGNGWYRCSVTATATATANATNAVQLATGNNTISYAGDGTSGILIWGAQLETGSTASAYQRVTDQYNVTEAGVPSVSYLFFDGADSMATPSINFTSTDKMTVFAGVRKLSDAGYQMLVESGASVATTNGTFGMLTTSGAGTAVANSLNFGLRGTTNTGYDARAYAANANYVMSSGFDIAGASLAAEIAPRVNGAAPSTLVSVGAAADAGTGNFTTQPLYIGARNSASLFFSGHLYSLIVRGAQSDTGQISSTETWVASRTGIVI